MVERSTAKNCKPSIGRCQREGLSEDFAEYRDVLGSLVLRSGAVYNNHCVPYISCGKMIDDSVLHRPKMSYHDALNYLAQKTSVIELYDRLGGRVAVCPEWNGRILTSTCEGLEGESFGCVHVQAIDAEHFEDYGGEDHWTLSPIVHSFAVETIKEHKAVLQRTLQTNDANGVPGEFHLSRTISLLNKQKIETWFGDAVADSFGQEDVSAVGFCSENTVKVPEKTCIASRLRGMFNPSPNTVVVLSTPPDIFASEPSSMEPSPMEPSQMELSSMDVDYLGSAPHGRIRHLPHALLVHADGRGRCQVTMPFAEAPLIIGAIELRFGTLTLWTFDVPNDSEKDAIRIYNSGHSHTEELDWTAYYETNCFSAARELLPDDSLTYYQATLHLNAGNDVLDGLVRQLFDVSLEEIAKKMHL